MPCCRSLMVAALSSISRQLRRCLVPLRTAIKPNQEEADKMVREAKEEAEVPTLTVTVTLTLTLTP